MKKMYLILILVIFLLSLTSAADWDNSMKFNKDTNTVTVVNTFGLGSDLVDVTLNENFCKDGRYCEADKTIVLHKDGVLIEDFKTLRVDDNSWKEQNIRWHKFEYWGVVNDYKDECYKEESYDEINGTYYYDVCEKVKIGEHEDWIQFKEKDEFKAGTYKIRTTGEIKPGKVYDWQIKVQGKWTTPFAIWGNISEGDDAEVILISPTNTLHDYTNGKITFTGNATIENGAHLTNISLWTNSSGTWEIINSTFIGEGVESIVAYYKLDEESGTIAYDSLGNYNLTESGTSSTPNHSGIINKSWQFAYDNNHLVSSINSPINGAEDRTLYCWVNHTTSGEASVCAGIGDGASNQEFALGIHTTNKIYLTGFSNDYEGNITVPTNEWVFLLATYNGSRLNLYVNGVSAGYYDTTYATANSPIRIGSRSGWGVGHRGFIDEVGLLNESISYERIIDLYNSGEALRNLPIKEYESSWINNVNNGDIWNIESCDTDGDCGFGTENYTINYKIFENSRTLNTSSYETKSETFSINTTSNSSLTAVVLVYNGTEYTTIKSGTVYSKALDIPVNKIGNNSVRWKFTYAGDTFYSDYSYQNINKTIWTLCNSSYTDKYLNITFKDEADLSFINASIPTSTWEYYLGSGTETKTYTFSNVTENLEYDFCAYPNLTFNVNPYVQYKQGTDYPQRIYDPEIMQYTSTITNKILYLLSSVDGIYVTFQVTNQADQALEGVEVTATRTIESEEVTIGTGSTGADGGVTFWLNPDFQHTFTFSKSGYDTYTTSFAPTQSGYTISLSGGLNTSVSDYFKGITYSVLPTNSSLVNDTVYAFGFQLNSTYWDLDEYGFNLRLLNGTIITGDATSTSGTQLTKLYDTNNQTVIFLDAYWTINGTSTNITRMWVVFNSAYTEYSVSNFFTDLKSFMDSGLFGLDDFGRYLIIFLIIAFSFWMISYRFGLTSPSTITFILFAVIFFLDVVIGLIPTIVLFNGTSVPYLLTFVSALILLVTIVREAQQ